MTGFFQQPELTPKPVLEPSSFDVLRDLYASKLVNQQANPYGFDPSKGQSQESLYTGNGRGTFNPYNGSYGPNPSGYANPGSMAGPSMGASGGGQGGMYGFGGGGQMGGGPQPGGDSSRSALIAYIMELMKGQGGQGMGQQQAPLMPMGNDGYTLNNQISQSGNAFDGCPIGHDAAPAQPPQVNPADFGNSFDSASKWLAMNPGNHGAFGTTPTHADPNNPFGMGGGSAPQGAPPPGNNPPPSNQNMLSPRGAPAIPSRNTGIPQGYPTPFDRNPTTVTRTPTGPTPSAPPPPPGGNMVPGGGRNPKFPIGMDSPYMFQRGPMSPLGMDAFPGAPGAGGGGFVGFEGGGQAPLSMGTPGGGGIQAFIQALMSGGGGGGGGMGGGMGMMKRRRPIGMDAGQRQPNMLNFRSRGPQGPRGHGNPYARQGR
jgi:hypothetical protein